MFGICVSKPLRNKGQRFPTSIEKTKILWHNDHFVDQFDYPLKDEVNKFKGTKWVFNVLQKKSANKYIF
jgi:hypothetical protein